MRAAASAAERVREGLRGKITGRSISGRCIRRRRMGEGGERDDGEGEGVALSG